jgi:hypothetical protein
MTDEIGDGEGGYTGNADGAGYSGYDPGPTSSEGSSDAAPPPHEIYDPPIEHDPIGQAIVGLPFAIVTGVGEAAVEGVSLAAAVGKEVIAWGVGELGLGAAEHIAEGGGSENGGSEGGDSSGGYGGADAGTDGSSGSA